MPQFRQNLSCQGVRDMTGTIEDNFRDFTCTEDGLSFTLRVTQLPDGSFQGKIVVTEGAADFNALYYGDSSDDGDSYGLKGSLNMNGRDGPDWDGATKLSDPGLGKQGLEKPTYLTAGDHYSFPLDIDSFDDVATLGIRATSTTTPEGSIKCVLTPAGEEDDHHDADPKLAVAAVADEDEGDADPDAPPDETADGADDGDGDGEGATPDATPDQTLGTMRDEDFFTSLAGSVGEVEDTPPEPEDESGPQETDLPF